MPNIIAMGRETDAGADPTKIQTSEIRKQITSLESKLARLVDLSRAHTMTIRGAMHGGPCELWARQFVTAMSHAALPPTVKSLAQCEPPISRPTSEISSYLPGGPAQRKKMSDETFASANRAVGSIRFLKFDMITSETHPILFGGEVMPSFPRCHLKGVCSALVMIRAGANADSVDSVGRRTLLLSDVLRDCITSRSGRPIGARWWNQNSMLLPADTRSQYSMVPYLTCSVSIPAANGEGDSSHQFSIAPGNSELGNTALGHRDSLDMDRWRLAALPWLGNIAHQLRVSFDGDTEHAVNTALGLGMPRNNITWDKVEQAFATEGLTVVTHGGVLISRIPFADPSTSVSATTMDLGLIQGGLQEALRGLASGSGGSREESADIEMGNTS